ncbi:sulfotransferase family protein [candidate division KSB1 bacterium]|nr:sulfotransferase family protein [candidate division KSB1 bacterium]
MLFRRKKEKPVIIVSGLPRSGTSMMMQMLKQGGVEIVSDGLRQPDENNPKGYYEFEKVKEMGKDDSWLPKCKGKVIKIVSVFLSKLPDTYRYKVIFMRRDMQEILASQRKMLVRLQKDPNDVDEKKLVQQYNKHLDQIQSWLKGKKNFNVFYVDYRDALNRPEEYVIQIQSFLDMELNAENMIRSVDKSLYRNRISG